MPFTTPKLLSQLGWVIGVAATCVACDEKVDDSYRDDLLRLDEIKVTPIDLAVPGQWFVDVTIRNLTKVSVPDVHDWRATAGSSRADFDTHFDTTMRNCYPYIFDVQPQTAEAFRVVLDLSADPASLTIFCQLIPNSFDPAQFSYQAARQGAAPVVDYTGPVKVELWAKMSGADCHTDDCPVNAHASGSALVTAAAP